MSNLTKRLRTPERTISRCRELLYVSAETAVEAANEIDRLAAGVERLRMTEQEREALSAGADALDKASAAARPYDRHSARGVPGSFRLLTQAATLRGFLARHTRETVAE